ncbi:copper-resistance protein, CopA family [Marinobacter sp. DSM 26671]|jgi:CopA family copper-resistance protein|uniref:Copper oxidase n=2 Tax=Marinobacteraceae TaxID=2887365 RepID=A0A5M3Q1D0_9GAMM|nr:MULTISPECIES: copper resistance system multicopper oxidase [Marinobacter]GBO89024.1 copper oxidase [Marinobacter salsuginis]SFE96961.1 copper-resistance protein, CopA family [Marinobacter sp. DSM 26671]
MNNQTMYSKSRRRFITQAGATGAILGLNSLVPAFAGETLGLGLRPEQATGPIDLNITRQPLDIGGRMGDTVTISGSIPGPLVRLKEGQDAVIRVTNQLDEDTSIHWHGLLLPYEMDGVPGVSYAGIKPGETFRYAFPVKQSGTYWYHSHSGLQEQQGHYGPLIIDPIAPEPFAYDREYVVMLSDWTFENPMSVLKKLKKQSDYYNYQRRTVPELFNDAEENGWGKTVRERMVWARSRMAPTDIADVSAATYTYLINGMAPDSNWTGLFRPGERIRLRFINGAAMSYFDVRIPGLKMTVVQADGQNVQPVAVDEFRIGVAETYDVIVEPVDEAAYTIFAASMDRSGYARGTLASKAGLEAAIPPLGNPPVRTMKDMGMGAMAMPGMTSAPKDGVPAMNMKDGTMAMPGEMPAKKQTMDSMDMSRNRGTGMSTASSPVKHGPDRHGKGNTMVAEFPSNRLSEPGDGLENNGRRVLVYTDLRSLSPYPDQRTPEREVELHLTGVMDRYMWSFDGKKFSEVDGPVHFKYGERLRLVLVNDTMMEHPIHLHGMWMELENGAGEYRPRKHTLNVKPGERLTALISADAPGNWAFHCHLLYHLDMGMFRVVSVTNDAVSSENRNG